MASESDSAEPIDPCERHARESQRLQPDRTPEPPSKPGEGTRQAGCIVRRLRSEVAWEADVGDLMNEAAAEIERLRLAIRRLAEQDATLSVVGGSVIVQIDETLTDAEREAIEWAMMQAGGVSLRAATLRGLLERTNPHGNKTTK